MIIHRKVGANNNYYGSITLKNLSYTEGINKMTKINLFKTSDNSEEMSKLGIVLVKWSGTV